MIKVGCDMQTFRVNSVCATLVPGDVTEKNSLSNLIANHFIFIGKKMFSIRYVLLIQYFNCIESPIVSDRD